MAVGAVDTGRLGGSPCPAVCAASVVANADACASVNFVGPGLPPTEPAPLAESNLSESQSAAFATDTTAPMMPPTMAIGNMLYLPNTGSREAQQKACQRLFQRRERSRDDQHVLLLQQRTWRRSWGPDAFGNCLGADAEAFAGVLVGPDMAPLVEATELRVPGADHRREFDTLRNLLGPPLHDRGQRARSIGVHANLIDAAQLAWLQRRRERCRQEDLAFLLDGEFACVGWPAFGFRRLGADGGTLVETVVRPDVDHLVQRTDLGVPERGELGELFADVQRTGEALLEGRDVARLQGIGAHFDDHRMLPLRGGRDVSSLRCSWASKVPGVWIVPLR